VHPSTQQPLDVISQYDQQQQQYVIGAGGLFNTEMTSVSSPHHSTSLFGPDNIITIDTGGSLLGITNQPPTTATALFGTGNHTDQLSPPQQHGGGLLMMGTGSTISQPSLFGNYTATGTGTGGGLLFGNSNGGGYGGGGLDDWSDLQAVLPADLGAEVLGVGMSHQYEQQQQLQQQQQQGSSFLAGDGTTTDNSGGDGSTNQRKVGGLFTGHSHGLW
jgi:hypothetical protein